MKTIMCVFAKTWQEIPTGRAYSFNTSLDVQVGSVLEVYDYKGKFLHVIEVKEELFKYFSYSTGELKKEHEQGCGVIKTLGEDTRILDFEDAEMEEYNGF